MHTKQKRSMPHNAQSDSYRELWGSRIQSDRASPWPTTSARMHKGNDVYSLSPHARPLSTTRLNTTLKVGELLSTKSTLFYIGAMRRPRNTVDPSLLFQHSRYRLDFRKYFRVSSAHFVLANPLRFIYIFRARTHFDCEYPLKVLYRKIFCFSAVALHMA